MKILDCYIDKNYYEGIKCEGTNKYIEIAYNRLSNNNLSGEAGKSAILLYTTKFSVVTLNYIHADKEQYDYAIAEDGESNNNIIKRNLMNGFKVDAVKIVGDKTLCDRKIYETLPSWVPAFFMNEPIIYYDGSYYYLAVWDGSKWRKVQLS